MTPDTWLYLGPILAMFFVFGAVLLYTDLTWKAGNGE
jgi:hypothetical protein